MKRYLVLVVSLLVSLLVVAQFSRAEEKNLILNGGFEAYGPDEIPEDWEPFAWSTTLANWVTDTTVFHSGKASARIEARGSHFWLQSSIPVEGETEYKLTFWVKTENLKVMDKPNGQIEGGYVYYDAGPRKVLLPYQVKENNKDFLCHN